MAAFHKIEGALCVLRGKNGVFKQTELYEYKGNVFAKASGGFIKLNKTQGTTHPDIFWDDMEMPFRLSKGEHGYLQISEGARKEIEAEPTKQIEHKEWN